MVKQAEPKSGKGDEELGIARVLLKKDLFAGIRSAEQLEALVTRAVTTVPKPYAMLLCRLLGYHPMHDQDRAAAFWAEIVAHREDLAQRLGREVNLRVAAMDLIALGLAPAELGTPIVLGPRVVRKIVKVNEGG
jgi:hypothetical protein